MSRESTVVLTPTARLARATKLQLALARRRAGQSAWIAPSVLTFSSWMGKLRDDWFLAGDDPRIPISGSQALFLWQTVIDRDIFVGEPRVAEMVAASWRSIHEHCLQAPEQWTQLHLSEDSRHFREWAGRFRALCEKRGLIDEWSFAAELPGHIRSGSISLPTTIVLAGFDLPMTPLQQTIVRAADEAGTVLKRAEGSDCELRETDGSGMNVSGVDSAHPDASGKDTSRPDVVLDVITEFPDAEAELRGAAIWAREQLEHNPHQSLAIVVPDLADRQASAERVFRQVFDPPGFALSPAPHKSWHISLGPTLNRWPVVAQALAVLRLDPGHITQPEVRGLVRSPFLGGAHDEHDQRARTLASLTARKPYRVSVSQIARVAEPAGASQLHRTLTRWEIVRRKHRDPAFPSEWVARFQTELEAIGFGHGRPLDSREYQNLQRWHDLLEEFSAQDLVVLQPLPRARAIRMLNQRAAAITFRERNPGAPVEILGVEEALGGRFDAVWVTTLDTATWPKPARRDPLIPGPIQQAMPMATSEACLERARAELAGLAGCASQTQGSFARGSDDAPLRATPLLKQCPVVQAEIGEPGGPVPLERIPDDSRAPAFPAGGPGGGTGLLQAQSDCPFRAFAEYRLGAVELTPRRPGLDARDRGNLVHHALEHFWGQLEGSGELNSLPPPALETRIETAAEEALAYLTRHNPLVMSPASRALEKTCLVRSLRQWLAREREREGFTVRNREVRITLDFGDLQLTGKIDRVDELEGGGPVLIDYKTGASGRNGWAPQTRLADVQLPAYALSLDPSPVAITFARLRPDAMGFDGLAEVDPGIPGIAVIGQVSGRSAFAAVESWQQLMRAWKTSLDQLAGDFIAGRAEVDPREKRVCKQCHLHGLCRINERVRVGQDD